MRCPPAPVGVGQSPKIAFAAMHVFRIGHPYPVHQHANGQEKTRADLTTAFFDVCCYLCSATPAEIAAWRGPFEYGIYEAAPGVPFVLVRFAGGRWLLDVSLNWRTMSDPAQRESWAEHDEPTPLSFALLDARSNALRAYRRFTPALPFVQQVRAIARRQLATYSGPQAVEQAIATAELMSLRLMSQQAIFYPSPPD